MFCIGFYWFYIGFHWFYIGFYKFYIGPLGNLEVKTIWLLKGHMGLYKPFGRFIRAIYGP